MMKKLLFLSVAMLMGTVNLVAQGIVVNKTDGTQVYFPAEQVSSIITYGYGEGPQPSEGDTQIFMANGVEFKMVKVEGGTFQMGSNDSDADSDEKPVHEVRLSTYSIGQTEVTQE